MAHPRRMLVRNIALAGDVDRELRRLAGVSRATSHRWRSRPGFPTPVKRLKGGDVWDLEQVRAWLAEQQAEEEAYER